MPSVQKLLRSVKRARNELFRESKNLPPGYCDFINRPVSEFASESHIWRSNEPAEIGDYPSHLVASIHTRGKGGVIIQFSGSNKKDRGIVLGSVTDIENNDEVVKALEEKTRRRGWKLELE